MLNFKYLALPRFKFPEISAFPLESTLNLSTQVPEPFVEPLTVFPWIVQVPPVLKILISSIVSDVGDVALYWYFPANVFICLVLSILNASPSVVERVIPSNPNK